jgi:hypothetical protein
VDGGLRDPSLVRAEIGRQLKARPFRERLRVYLDPVHVTAEGHEMFAGEIEELVSRAQRDKR